MTFDNLLYEVIGNVAVVTINRPDSLNALNHKTLLELEFAIQEINSNSDIHAFILTGSGKKAFVAGADIHDLDNISAIEGLAFMELGQRIFNAIEDSPKPSIAAVNGYALGGGNELCMSCDIRIASENAKFGQPEIKLGNIPGWGGTQRLPRLIGKGRASQLIFTGDFLSAQDAALYGLVNNVFPQEELMDAALSLANKIAAKGAVSLKMAKQAINEGLRSDIQSGLIIEAHGVCMCLTTDDQKEGVNAFLEKRDPVFKGR